MKKYLIFTGFLLSLVLVSCGNPIDAENALFEKTMAIHDEIMPSMGEINRLSRELKATRGQVDPENKEMLGRIENALRDLGAADERMMGWMNSFRQMDRLREEMDHAGIMEYLEEEKANIQKISDQMKSGIEQAKELLEALKKDDAPAQE